VRQGLSYHQHGDRCAIRKALKKGDTGIRKIATTLGVGTGTVQRIKAGMVTAG
jgi:hypothetical protein